MTEQKIICIVAAQRAGTTALQRALVGTRKVRNFGEIFQDPEQTASPAAAGSFFEFARANDLRLAETMKRRGASEVADRYIAHLRELAGPMHVLIDVKLNSWLGITPAWAYPHEEPLFLLHLKRAGAIFIFVWREDLAEQVLSMFISRKLGIWHNLDAEKVAGRTFKAPLKRMQRDARYICGSEADMRNHLREYDAKIEIAYEELFRNGKLGAPFVAAFEALSGLTLSDPSSPGIRQNSASKRDIVINYKKTVQVIRAVESEYRLSSFRAQGGGDRGSIVWPGSHR